MGGGVECHDGAVAEIAHKQLAVINAEAIGREGNTPRRIQVRMIILCTSSRKASTLRQQGATAALP